MSPIYLLDTSVYSQPLRRKPVIQALMHWQAAGDGNCKVSIVSIAEVEFGLNLEGSKERHERYQTLSSNRLDVIPPINRYGRSLEDAKHASKFWICRRPIWIC